MTDTREHTYVAIFNGKQIELKAPSLYGAKLKAVEHFKPGKSRQHMVAIYLACTADGQDVNIIPQVG